MKRRKLQWRPVASGTLALLLTANLLTPALAIGETSASPNTTETQIMSVSGPSSYGDDWAVTEDGVLTAYNGTNPSMDIPEGVKAIGDGQNIVSAPNVTVTEVIIPSTVTQISQNAFRGWTELKTIHFSDSKNLKTICDGAFVNVNIQNLVIPEGVETIGGDGALETKDVVSISLPSTISSLGGTGGVYKAFCTNAVPTTLTSITVAAGNKAYSVKNQAVYDANGKTLLYCASGVTGSYAVADGTETVASYAFSNFPAAMVTLPAGLQTISDHAFTGAKLTTVSVPGSVQAIGESAFYNAKVKSVTFAEGVKTIGRSAFGECAFPKDTAIVLPASLVSVGAGAFDCLGDNGASSIRVSGAETALTDGFIPSYNVITLKGTKGSTAEAYVAAVKTAKGDKCKLVFSEIKAEEPAVVQSVLLDKTTLELTVGDMANLSAAVLPAEAASAAGLSWVSGDAKIASVDQNGQVTAVAAGETNITVTSANGKTASCAVTVSATQSQDGFAISGGVLTAYTGSEANITLPSTVKVIGDGTNAVFDGKSAVKSVKIPSSVTEIANNAFYACSKLESVGFSDAGNLKTVGEKAFYLAAGIKTLAIPEGVTDIGAQAFVNMHALQTISLPSTLNIFGSGGDWFGLMFAMNTTGSAPSKLTDVNVASGCKLYSSENGAVYSADGKELLYCPAKKTQIALRGGVERIGNYAFNKSELQSLTIPASVTAIGAYAFNNAGLMTIEIPGTVKMLEKGAFYYSKLRNIKLNEGLESIGENAFSLAYVTGITIPVSVKSLGKNFLDFENYSGQYVRLLGGNTVLADEFVPYYENIKVYAPNGSTAETYVTGKQAAKGASCKLTFYAESTFVSVAKLTISKEIASLERAGTVQLSATVSPEGAQTPGIAWSSSNPAVATVDTKGKVTGVQPGAAVITASTGELTASCTVTVKSGDSDYLINDSGEITAYLGTSWSDLIIPAEVGGTAVTGIAAKAFANFTAIKTVTLPASVKTIGAGAFQSCANLTAITMPGVTAIGAGAFEACSALKSAAIPAGVAEIPANAFSACRSLSYVTLPGTVKALGAEAFSGCTALTALALPEGLETIHARAFFKCPLETLRLPATLKNFGDEYIGDVFEDPGKIFADPSMTTITVAESSQTFSAYDGILYSKDGTETCFCPRGRTEATVREGTKKIGDYTFFMCIKLESSSLPDSVTEVGRHAFQYDEGLTACELPAKLEKVSDSAFFGCENWTGVDRIPATVRVIGAYGFAECKGSKIVIPDGVTHIEPYAFWGYELGLSSIILPSTLKTIGDSAFSWAKDVKELVIPEGVTEIGRQAFARMDSLEKLTLPSTLTTIGESAFMGPTSNGKLLKTYIPANVKTIGAGAFANRASEMTIVADRADSAAAAYATANQFALELKNKTETDFEIVNGVLVAYRGSNSEVVIPNGVTEIGAGAFQCEEGDDKADLKKVTIPASVTAIGRMAFQGCELTEVVFESGSKLRTVGESAFAYCTKLPSITLPDGVVEVGKRAFDSDGLLGGVKIPASVESIGDYAFNVCTSLKEVTFAAKGSLKTIGTGTFYNCFRLSSLVIPEGVTEIGDYAFRISSGLKKLSLPSTLTKLGTTVPEAFSKVDDANLTGADALTEIVVADGNKNYASQDGALYSADGETLLYCPSGKTGTLNVKDGTKTISAYAFQRSKLDSVALPDTLKNIGNCAFLHSSLVSAVIPDSTESIGKSAFFWCDKLKTVELGAGLRKIGESAFSTSPLNGITIPASVESVEKNAFDELSGWVHVLGSSTVLANGCIPATDSIVVYGASGSTAENYVRSYKTSLGDKCGLTFKAIGDFVPVSGLKLNQTTLSLKQRESAQLSATLTPENATHQDLVYQTLDSGIASVNQTGKVTAVQPGSTVIRVLSTDGASADCAVTVTKDETISDYNLSSNGSITGYVGTDSALVIPAVVNGKTVTGIAAGAFRNNWDINSVVLPDSLTDIGDSAFQNCINLGSVTFGTGLKNIGAGAFERCGDLTELSLPDGLETMGAAAFQNCEKLKSVRFPGSLKAIPESAFEENWRLVEVDIPLGVESVGKNAFYECEGMERLTLPTSLRTIGEGAFIACVRLQEVQIPEGVTSIGREAFMSCTAMTAIHLPSTLATLGDSYVGDVFERNASVLGCNHLETVTVEPGNKNFSAEEGLLYNADGTELLFCPRGRTEAVVQNGTAKLGRSSFFFCRALTSVSLPASLREIGDSAFFACDTLPALKIPVGVIKIGDKAFADCERLKTLEISASVREIGQRALSSTGLETLTIPDGVSSLGEGAMSGNLALKTVTIPASVTNIGVDLLRDSTLAEIITSSEQNPIYSYAKSNNIPVRISGGGPVSSYVLTFDTNGGSAIPDVRRTSATMIDLSACVPARDGFTFAGWYADVALTKPLTSVKLTANTTVYAKWTEKNANPFPNVPGNTKPSGGMDSVKIEVTVKDDTATVTVSDTRITEIASGKTTTNTGTVKIDVSETKAGKAVIPAKVVTAVDKSESATGLEVALKDGTVKLDKTALAAITKKGGDMTISVEKLDNSKLSENSKEILGAQASTAVVVDVNVAVNGSRTSSFDGGKVNISVPYTPKANEDTSKLTVWYITDDGRIEPKPGSYNEKTKQFEFTTDHLSQYVLVSFPFKDVAASTWYYGNVAYAYMNGLFSGTGDTTFSPDTAMTRAMLVMVLYRMEKEPAATAGAFTDVASDAWYAKAVAWAAANKIVTGGTDGAFAPEQNVTREQMAAILYRYSKYKNYDVSAGENMNLLSYTDVAAVSEYAVPAMQWACGAKLMQGTNDSLMPQGDAQRAQVAAILHRFAQNVAK